MCSIDCTGVYDLNDGGGGVTKTPGRPKRGDLADMTILPSQPAGYELPDPDECEEYKNSIVLEAGHELLVRLLLWKDRLIVEFAIMQVVRHNGLWVEVARIDTCEGSVYKHQLRKTRPDDQVGQREEVERVPTVNPWTVIDRWYEDALGRMQREWVYNLRRWRGGAT